MHSAKRYNPDMLPEKMERGWFFYLFLIPLFFSVISPLMTLNLPVLLINSLGFLLMYGTFITARIGFKQENEYKKKTLTKAPKIPYKQLAALNLAITSFYLSFVAGNYTLFNSLFIAGLSFVGFVLYYGLDPRKDKLKDFGDISSELVLKTLNESSEKIENIKKEAQKIEERVLSEKVSLAVHKADKIFDALVDDPKDIRVARKFLVVYLDGISDVIKSYNNVKETHISTQTREKLLSLMDDVEIRLEKELARLRANNLFNLDVNIDTLKEQIKN